MAAERGFEIVKVGHGERGLAKKSTGAKAPAPKLPPSTSAPGSRTASRFFDRYERFYETSQTSPYEGRLNLRYEAIFAENRAIFANRRVLDIASHDGRWSLAALECGARSVIGIEGREDLVASSVANLDHYGYSADRYRFVAGDVMQVLAEENLEVDVVLCLGFLYHTLRYNELLHRIKQTGARHVIQDTESEWMTAAGGRPAILLRNESTLREGNAIADQFSFGDTVLIGRPNRKAVELMMKAYGFELERLSDWGGLIRDNPRMGGVGDYAAQTRITMLFGATS